MATYRLPRMLTLLAWEEALRHGPFAEQRGWSAAGIAEDLHLDFSRVEFADFGALARALLLLDAAVRYRIPATVTLPTASVLPAGGRQEVQRPPATGVAAAGTGPPPPARRIWARGDALTFMRHVGFLDSLRAPHWAAGAVHIRHGPVTGAQDVPHEPDPALGVPESDPRRSEPYQRRRVFPFRWLEPMPAAQLREAESYLAVSSGLEDLGLSRSDARTLSQTVLTELVANVAEHGGDGERPPVALVGAILLSAGTYSIRQKGIHPGLGEIADRAVEDGSRVLRLVVADSGASLVARLEPEETVLGALGAPSGAAAGRADAQHGLRGLSWVGRVVRSYHGGVQVRSADLLAGALYSRTAEGTEVAETGLGYVPGTLLELTLPTGPYPSRPPKLWGSKSAPAAVPVLRWVNCAFDPQGGLGKADRARLALQMRPEDPDRHDAGLVVTIPVHDADRTSIDDGWRTAIHQVLEFMSSIARAAAVVVVFPDAEPHLLDPCIEAFNEGITSAAEDSSNPILALGCYGQPVWCGGSPPLRMVLNSLSSSGDAMRITEARNAWRMAGGEATLFSQALRANGHLLIVSRGWLQLRPSLPAVHRALERAVSGALAKEIGRGGHGVEVGMFRGPTLRVTNRWIRVEALLAGTVGVPLAAFVMARKVEDALQAEAMRASRQAEQPTEVFRAASAPRTLARHLSECLILTGRYYSQPPELDTGEPPVGERVPLGAKVVLCADLISTENTVRRAAMAVAGGEADPLIIACAVDARDIPGPVTLLNRAVPVVSLTEVRISPMDADTQAVADIDPLMLHSVPPVAGGAVSSREADLSTWFVADPDVFRLGHIEDPPHRHYSAFIRLQALRQQETRDEVTTAVLASVRQAFAEIDALAWPDSVTASPMAIWYVESDGNAEGLAGIVRERLAATGAQISAVTPIPRWTAGDEWVFPTRVSSMSGPVGVLIIHWWAITGSTLLQLVRLAAESGARWVAAVCMLNQLDVNDADTLVMLRAVSAAGAQAGVDGAKPGGSGAALVPVAIRFVALSSITMLDAHDCPICKTRERYQLGDEPAPPRLAHHAQLLLEMLRPRELAEVSRDSAADLFTVPVTGEEAIDYLRWRGLLLDARRDIRARQEVIDRLRELTAAPSVREWTSTGLIRLLAAEQQWLRLPPLHLELAKDLLGQVCVRGLEQVTAPPWLRVQALMVMSVTIPQRLVELLPRLLALAGSEAKLADQLFLDCWRLLLRSPGSSSIDVDQLRRNLVDCRDYLDERRAAPPTEDHLHVVRDLITIANFRVLRKPKSAQEAWERLLEDLADPVIRHRLEAELLLVRSFVEDLEQVEPSPQTARDVGADWDTCVRQLSERVLANLPPLRDILAGDFVGDWLGRRDQHRVLTLARPGVGELRAVTGRLQELAHGPWRPADPSWQALRQELLDRINWWNRIFLAAHIPDHAVPALMVGLIRSAPVKLAEPVARVLRPHHAVTIARPELSEVTVFCPEKLLEQILGHLLENVRKHRVDGAECRLLVDYALSSLESVELVVRNSGTRPSTPPGQGLKALNDKLRPFGGKLTSRVLAQDEWTFEVVTTLPLWHGG
jgi:hypothetical protein